MFDTQENPLLQFIFLLLLIGSTIYLFIQSSQARKKEVPRKLVTVIECSTTRKERKREFKEGDYIGKQEGECENGGIEIIKAIYSIEEKPTSNNKP